MRHMQARKPYRRKARKAIVQKIARTIIKSLKRRR